MSKSSFILSPALAVLVVALGLAEPLYADLLEPNVLTTEMMMESIGVNAEGVGRALGIDDGAPISFSTYTDPADLSFAFATDPGQTYHGQPLALVGAGFYNAAESRWEGQAVASAGSDDDLFMATWTLTETSMDPYTVDSFWSASLYRGWELDAEGGVRIWRDPDGSIRSEGWGYLTINHFRIAGVQGTDRIPWRFLPWEWDKFAIPDDGSTPFRTRATGLSPESGGAGWAIANVTQVPEPASLALLALGGLAGFARRR